MKLPFSHDEIFRGALILLLGVVFGIILGLLRFCEATPQDVRTQLPLSLIHISEPTRH